MTTLPSATNNSSSPSDANLAAALRLAEAGFAVFPCQDTPLVKETDKAPCSGVMWREQSTNSAVMIRAWWSWMPAAIPAIDLAKSNLIVIDLDRRPDGPDGVNHFRELARAHGDALDNMPVVATSSGGFHVYYRQPAGLALGNAEGALKGKGINVRGKGGYVIAPGALRSDGRGWRPESKTPDLVTAFAASNIPPLPDWLRNLITAERVPITFAQRSETSRTPPSAKERAYAARALQDEARKVTKAPEGMRNNALNASAFAIGTLIPRYGLSREEAETALSAAALATGLARDEITKTLKSGLDNGMKNPRPPLPVLEIPECVRGFVDQGQTHFKKRTQGMPSQTVSVDRAMVRRVADVDAEPVRWFWPDQFAIKNQAVPGVDESASTETKWPMLDTKAAHVGLAWDVVEAITPNTEADPIAILLQYLAAFGNAVGRGPYYQVEADRHYPNLFMLLIGASAKGRKGTSQSRVLQIMKLADDLWESERIQSGLSSGEGLIWAVRDPIFKTVDGEPVQVDAGVSDKRLLVFEAEFASTLAVMKREGNTLSPIVRDAWDRGKLGMLTKNSLARATNAMISIVGHITADELRRELDRSSMGNGFANRFLFACIRRTQLLPHGGNMDPQTVAELARKTAEKIDQARHVQRVTMTPEARRLWESIYAESLCRISRHARLNHGKGRSPDHPPQPNLCLDRRPIRDRRSASAGCPFDLEILRAIGPVCVR